MITKENANQKKIEAYHEIISAWKFRALRAESKLRETEKLCGSLPSIYQFNSMQEENLVLKRKNEVFSKQILLSILAVVLFLNMILITGTIDHLSYSEKIENLKHEVQFLSMRNSTLLDENETLYEVNDQFFDSSDKVKEMQKLEAEAKLMVMENEESF